MADQERGADSIREDGAAKPSSSSSPRWPAALVLVGMVGAVVLFGPTAQTPIDDQDETHPTVTPPDAAIAGCGNPHRAPRIIEDSGWVTVDAGPVAGRMWAAGAWTTAGLFVWGGASGCGWALDGAIHDPSTGEWRLVPPLPEGICPPRGPAVALGAGDLVVLRLDTHYRADCAPAAVLDVGTGRWELLHAEFFRRATLRKPLVWTGSWFVSPWDLVAYNWPTGQTIELPTFPGGWMPINHAHWNGASVIAGGSSGVLSWTPGAARWEPVGPPLTSDWASASAGWDGGSVVIDTRTGAFLAIDGEWTDGGGVPLVLEACPPSAVAVGEVPVVRTCSGIAAWDRVRSSWVPFPLDSLDAATLLVGGDGALWSVGPSIRRLTLGGRDGTLSPARVVPIGTLAVRLPEGFDLVRSFGSVSGDVAPIRPGLPAGPTRQVGGVTLAGEQGVECDLRSTVTRDDVVGAPAAEGSSLELSRTGLPPLTAVRSLSDGAVTYTVDLDAQTEVFDVSCRARTLADAESAARSIVASLWSPWHETRRSDGGGG